MKLTCTFCCFKYLLQYCQQCLLTILKTLQILNFIPAYKTLYNSTMKRQDIFYPGKVGCISPCNQPLRLLNDSVYRNFNELLK